MAPRKPTGLGVSGRALWSEIADTYDLRPDERRLLEDACREADLIDRLEAEIADPAHELQVRGSMGQPVSSPLVSEIRQHRTTLRALFAQLKLPDEQSAAEPRAVQARSAAQARWSRGA
jgi:hypothetical protein